MAGATGVPTGLSPTAGVDYTIPLPYAVPDISNRVGYYFAASTIGDFYRKAVAGDAAAYAWIQAGATLPDSTFNSAFSEVPGQLTTEMMRSWFRAAYAALESPGGSSVNATIVVNADGSATIGAPKVSGAATTPTPDLMVTTGVGKDVQAQLANQVVTDTGLPAGPSAPAMALPTWLKWAAAIAGLLLLVSFLRKAS